jgi:hypothetical protein
MPAVTGTNSYNPHVACVLLQILRRRKGFVSLPLDAAWLQSPSLLQLRAAASFFGFAVVQMPLLLLLQPLLCIWLQILRRRKGFVSLALHAACLQPPTLDIIMPTFVYSAADPAASQGLCQLGALCMPPVTDNNHHHSDVASLLLQILRRRKGFVRIALQTGASLVPVFGFGETDLFETYVPPPNSLLAKVQRFSHR